ncbi:MAG: hypothetical protein ACRC9R_05585, partial [Enterovibrio sp.]
VKDGRKQRLNVLATEYSGVPSAQLMEFFYRLREQMRARDASRSPIVTLGNERIIRSPVQLIGTDILLNDPDSNALSVIAAMRACIDPRALDADKANLQVLVDVETMRNQQVQQRPPLQQTQLQQAQLHVNAPTLEDDEEDELR